MRAPAFWWREKPGVLARLLAPASAIYGAAAAKRMAEEGLRIGAPVICVGNFVAGGAGKTPCAIALAQILKKSDEYPMFLSRGYGGALGRGSAPTLIDPAIHNAALAGDEPLLLARVAPTIVCADRVAGARLAKARGASVVILDDGLQNPALVRDFALAVIDGSVGLGNLQTIPAGPLRAPLDAQLPHVSAALVVGEGEAGARAAALLREGGKRVFFGRLAPDANAALRVFGQKVVAFAGIGLPQKFFATLENCGARIVARCAFADHHVYRLSEIVALQRKAQRLDALLVCTEKDMVKIAPLARLLQETPPPPQTLPVRLFIDQDADLKSLILEALTQSRAAC